MADAVFLYGVRCEYSNKCPTHARLCILVAMITLILRYETHAGDYETRRKEPTLTNDRSLSLTAVGFFILAAVNPKHPRLDSLIILNGVLYFPPKFVSLTCAMYRAMKTMTWNRETLVTIEKHNEESDNTNKWPMVLVIASCHKEKVDVVLDSINSVARSQYPPDRMHIFLCLDGRENMHIFTKVVEAIGVQHCLRQPAFPGIETTLGNSKLTIFVFEHGGKTRCQGRALEHIWRNHPEYIARPLDTCVLLLDTDTILDKTALILLTVRLVRTPQPWWQHGRGRCNCQLTISAPNRIINQTRRFDLWLFRASRASRKPQTVFSAPSKKRNTSSMACCSKEPWQHWAI